MTINLNGLDPIQAKLEPLNAVPRRVNRMTIYAQVHQERSGEHPISCPLSFSEGLTLEEDVYARRHTATEKWEPLDLGWLGKDKAGLVVIENLEGREVLVNPTEEEKQVLTDRFLKLAPDIAGAEELAFTIPPRQHRYFTNQDLSRLRVRCNRGTARFKITVFPR